MGGSPCNGECQIAGQVVSVNMTGRKSDQRDYMLKKNLRTPDLGSPSAIHFIQVDPCAHKDGSLCRPQGAAKAELAVRWGPGLRFFR